MLIPKSEITSIKENKVTLVESFISLKIDYDFNFLSQLLEKNDLPIYVKSTIGNMRDVFQIRKVADLFKELKPTINFLGDLFSYEKKENDGIDLFFSFLNVFKEELIDILSMGFDIINCGRVAKSEISLTP